MAVQDLLGSIAAHKDRELSRWRYYLVDWLVENTSSIQSVSYERIRSYVLSIAPGVSDVEIQRQLLLLKDQGVIHEKRGALGGQYWFVTEQWRDNLREACERPSRAIARAASPTEAPSSADEEALLSGDIIELFQGTALERLVLLLLRRKGYANVPEHPNTPYKGTPFDVWAETDEGVLILVECKGWEQSVSGAAVREFVERVRHAFKQECSRKLEPWIVITGDLNPSVEKLCRDNGLRVVRTLDLIREAMAHGVLGIGVRSRRPYVARLGEKGVFLRSEELKAAYEDPTLAVRIVQVRGE